MDSIFFEVFLIFVGALSLSLIVALVIRNPGPWKSFWVFLGVLFVTMFAFSLWVTPIGPVWYDVARLDTLLLGLLIALLLGAAGERGRDREYQRNLKGELDLVAEAKKEYSPAFGIFFWVFISLMVLLIVAGLLRFIQLGS